MKESKRENTVSKNKKNPLHGFFLSVIIVAKEVIKLKMSDKVYDILKYVAQYFLPALGTLYFALAGIWGLPYGEQIVGTITAVDTFLGVLLGISKANYDKSKEGQ